jgi:hypothetical protein
MRCCVLMGDEDGEKGKGNVLGDVDDSGNMPLHGGTGQKEVDLVV